MASAARIVIFAKSFDKQKSAYLAKSLLEIGSVNSECI